MIFPAILCSVLALQAPTAQGPGAPAFAIPRIDQAVVVDGQLNEPAWQKATRLAGFSEYRPVDGQKASEQTEVLVWYSPSALHFGIVAHDSAPGSVRATNADRDNIGLDDSVRIFLDTFNDRRRAFIFGVNPLGVQEDGVQTEGSFNAGRMFGMNGSVDLSPDYQFDSKGRLTSDGYVVEVRIPFKSLRYPTTAGAKWGVNILRKTQRTGREDTWTDARRVASFLAQSGQMEGLGEIQRGVVTELQPFVTAASNGTRVSASEFSRPSPDLSTGANLRLGFTNTSVDATINPDFSQVESDAAQVTLNERFALFYAEKRPFFLEGIELFSTPNQLVYTRRIVDPIGGGKITGKKGKTGFAVLSALDQGGTRDTWSTIARVRRDVGANSLAGLTYTDRSNPDGSNRVAAADARLVFKKLYYVLGQVGGSWTDKAGATTQAPMFQAEVDRTARVWGFNYRLSGFGRAFDAQSGFVPRNNIVEFRAFNRFSYYGPRGSLLETASMFFGPSRLWTYGDFGRRGPIEGGESANASATLRGGWSLSTNVARAFVHFDPSAYASYTVAKGAGQSSFVLPGQVSNWGGTYSVTSPIFEKMNARVEFKTGGTAIFAEAADGRETRVTTSLGLRPTSSLRLEGSFVRSRITRDRTDTEFARSTIPRLKLEYQPKRALFFRMITEYRSDLRSPLIDSLTGAPLYVGGALAGEQRFRGLRVDWLASFKPTPGTVAFFGYGASRERNRALYGSDSLERTSDGFFVKLAYQLRK